MQSLEIEQSQKIDRPELAVDGRFSADSGADRKIGA
jgi:hypothetical protein